MRFLDDGFTVTKITDKKFKISKRSRTSVYIRHVTESIFVMYKGYSEYMDKWEFNVNYPHYDFEHHYNKRCEFPSGRVAKCIAINENTPSLRQYIRHRHFDYDGTFAINIEPYAVVYRKIVDELCEFIVRFAEDKDKYIRDPMIPNCVKYVAMKCDGDVEKFVYVDGWNANPHYLERLLTEYAKYSASLDNEN